MFGVLPSLLPTWHQEIQIVDQSHFSQQTQSEHLSTAVWQVLHSRVKPNCSLHHTSNPIYNTFSMGGGKEVPSDGDIVILLPVVQIRKKKPLLKLRSWSIAGNIDSMYAWKFHSKASKNALHKTKMQYLVWLRSSEIMTILKLLSLLIQA